MRYCLNCGMTLEDDDRFCVRCGKPVQAEKKNTSPDGKTHMTAPAGRKKQGSLAKQEPEHDGGTTAGVKPDVQVDSSSASGMNPERRAAAAAGSAEAGRRAGSTGRSGGRSPRRKSSGMGYRQPDRESEENGQRKTILLLLLVCLVFGGVLVALLVHPGRSGGSAKDRETDGIASETPADGDIAEAADLQNGPGGASAEAPDPAVEVSENEQEEEARRAAEQQAAAEAAERAAEEQRIAEEKAAAEREAAEKAAEEQRIAEEKAAAEKEAAEKKAAEEAARLAQNRPEAVDDSYLLPDSSSRNYTYEELSRLDDYTLQMAINEIYARHGRRFDTPSIQEYFNKKTWYNGTIAPKDFDGNESAYFNSYESANREMMAKVRDDRAAAAQKAEQQSGSSNAAQ